LRGTTRRRLVRVVGRLAIDSLFSRFGSRRSSHGGASRQGGATSQRPRARSGAATMVIPAAVQRMRSSAKRSCSGSTRFMVRLGGIEPPTLGLEGKGRLIAGPSFFQSLTRKPLTFQRVRWEWVGDTDVLSRSERTRGHPERCARQRKLAQGSSASGCNRHRPTSRPRLRMTNSSPSAPSLGPLVLSASAPCVFGGRRRRVSDAREFLRAVARPEVAPFLITSEPRKTWFFFDGCTPTRRVCPS